VTAPSIPGGARFAALLDMIPDAIVGVDGDDAIVLVNTEATDLFGFERDELIMHPVGLLIPGSIHAALSRARAVAAHDPTRRTRAAAMQVDVRRKDGSAFPAEIHLTTTQIAGRIIVMLGIHNCGERTLDTNEGLLVSAAIRDAGDRDETRREEDRAGVQRERDVMESRLHQTHRLESLGQLAGGVAHDFNNILAAILNYSGFVSDEVAAELESRPVEARARLTAVLSDVAQIGAAAERAAGLTHQLLAFARREVRHPEVLDVNAVVVEVESLLRRTLGEHVKLVTRAASDLKAVRADRGQVEQVLLNLAVNARDAMANGGTLTVVTENFTVDDAYAELHPLVEAGSYVRLRVTDTGVGMNRETLDRAFEPFFSTKPKDKGTGLGLATVYGIVSQTAGMVELHSEVGTGTTVTILLPTVAAAITGPDLARPDSAHRAGETVLVVEDDELVLDVACRTLTQNGYHVLVAHDGAEALTLMDSRSGAIDLLLTDVVMPGATGKEVAETVSELRPGVRVLYMSGYPESVIASQGVIDRGIRLLSKPFKSSDLLAHVRAVLDAP
jgi:PAS domain S-box-containing protein